MTEHEPPGRALDVLVHRALWPDADIVDKPGYEGFLIDHPTGAPWKEWRAIPRYSTDLMAWDWSREGWEWVVSDWAAKTDVLLLAEHFIVASSFVEGRGFSRQAYARCLCVLQWAAVKKASDE